MRNATSTQRPLMRGRLVPAVASAALFLSLLPVNSAAAGDAAVQNRRTYRFTDSGVAFDNCFDGARLNDCVELDDGQYRLVIRPENRPVNNSAWYAFRVASKELRTITVQLQYEGGSHRYHPKTSRDGTRWTPLPQDAVTSDKKTATFQLSVDPQPLWVAGQEMIGCKELEAWVDKMARLPFVEKGVLGHSVGGRPIWKFVLGDGRPQGCVFIIGRQHPPEVTGSIALMSFVETIAGESEVAEQFRRAFTVVVVPLVNPDGVAAGHWRHNLNGVDLNRDWGPFSQPEIRALRDEILKCSQAETPPLCLLLDFHSTHRDLFYVQTDEQPTRPADFARRWLEALSVRLPDYTVRRVATAGGKPTSKKWGYETLGIPSITCEYGDNTDRDLLRRVSRCASEEMMRLLLAEVAVEVESR